jgi:hypothetical protein
VALYRYDGDPRVLIQRLGDIEWLHVADAAVTA